MEEDREMVAEFRYGAHILGLRGLSRNIFMLISRMASGALTCFFALAGAFIGAFSGALAGLASDTGIIRGTVQGSIVGAVLAIEVLEVYYSYWRFDQSISQILPDARRIRTDFAEELFDDRISHQLFSARLMAYHWQIDDISENGASKGLSRDLLVKLPSFVMHRRERDGHQESILCPICLQDIMEGETARKLPICLHKFHLLCVDKWLAAHCSCPVCRRTLLL